MVVFWFLLALVLLAAALLLLRLDARQRRGAAAGEVSTTSPVSDAGSAEDASSPSDDDEAPPVTPPSGDRDDSAEQCPDGSGAPRLAPFQRAVGPADAPPDDSAGPLTDTDSSPRLLDRVRSLLPARGRAMRQPERPAAPAVDPLADSPVVRWLEDREFEPTPTPAPEFRHGDFAGGLSALGTVSHGMFRGRRAIMGVTGGRTVLALRRDTVSDVVLDLSRPDVDAEPGFHDAGQVALLEARTSDYGRLTLIDRDRLTTAVSDVPAEVRRIWAEGEWVAATVDGVDDPSGWDDVVMALHAAADVVAPLPPIGGRARALPLEIDPGSPGSADGPEADPTVGMDGEVGTATHGEITPVASQTESSADVSDPADAGGVPQLGPVEVAAQTTDPDARDEAPEPFQAEPRRAGHLRLVPERKGARDLADVPVVADRGDAFPDDAAADSDDEAADNAAADKSADAAFVAPAVAEEPDPFAEIMEPSGPVPARGDVAADHLPERPPLSRPTRGVGQAYPEDASVPPLAAGVTTGGSGIKPLGSQDDEDEIRTEVERFDAARIDGGSDLDSGTGGRHAQPADDQTPVWLRPEVTPVPSRAGSGKHRRADPEDEQAASGGSDATGTGRERPGVDPDVEQTARLRLPPDIRD
ncbi:MULTISPECIES: hypothetical protein [unclassified Dietzia]|uniref:hypothetical protein n=1 Tax=unclassified Dietzia TaxID=2617939 RepID=UPI001E2B5A57|nr:MULTISPECIES: hypothetical protein [unclassified Dietzia]